MTIASEPMMPMQIVRREEKGQELLCDGNALYGRLLSTCSWGRRKIPKPMVEYTVPISVLLCGSFMEYSQHTAVNETNRDLGNTTFCFFNVDSGHNSSIQHFLCERKLLAKVSQAKTYTNTVLYWLSIQQTSYNNSTIGSTIASEILGFLSRSFSCAWALRSSSSRAMEKNSCALRMLEFTVA